MLPNSDTHSNQLTLQFHKRKPTNSWWAPVWRGLVVDKLGKHYQTLHSAIWLYLYLLLHADRKSGRLIRKVATIAEDMGVKNPTVRRWLVRLDGNGYIRKNSTGRALQIHINRWKPIHRKTGRPDQ
jgi:DNA-binding MarR family transcriptional regulator